MLVLVALALPLFLVVLALAVDGANLRLERQHMQNAVDATALAAAADLPSSGPCTGPDTTPGTCANAVRLGAERYSSANGGPATLHACDPGNSADTNCYLSPYKGSDQIVQVRLHVHVHTFLAGAVGLGHVFQVSATAAARKTAVTTPGPGGTTLAYAHSQTQCDAVHISGTGNTFQGAVVSSAGVNESGTNTGDLLVYGAQIDTSKCLTTKPGWTEIKAQPPVDWPVPLPTLTFGGPAGSVTKVNGVPCAYMGDKYTVKTVLAPGLYCAASKITVNQTGLTVTNVGYIAPEITWSSGHNVLTGYTGASGSDPNMYAQYGGLLFDAYGSSGLNQSGSINSFTGTIFAPIGNAQVSGSGAVSSCGGSDASACGFIEADTIQISGGNGFWHGTGPDIGGPPHTTTGVTLAE